MVSFDVVLRRRDLTEKLKTKELQKDEAKELKDILEKQKETALSLGDAIAILGIGILLALVIDYLTKDENEEGYA